jgi:hypothetical protein
MTKIYLDTKIQILWDRDREIFILYKWIFETQEWVLEDRISGLDLATWWKKKLWEEQAQSEEEPI